ncbi:MAG: endonuclease/exonuclease/phosphatase family protein [Pirellulaceae bacterium]
MARRRSRKRTGKLPFYPVLVLLLIGFGGYLGCDADSLQPPLESMVNDSGAGGGSDWSAGGYPASTTSGSSQMAGGPTTQVPQALIGVPERTRDRLLISSFNIHTFGPSKLGKPWVMERYADIIRQFDVVAIQEIRNKDQRAVPTLIDLVNSQGARYAYTISPRIGREESRGYYEQYAFIYDTERVQTGPEFCYVVNDAADLLHREPFVGRFAALGPNGFRFTLINIHTDPDEIDTELDVLADTYRQVREFEYPEDDVILLGDFNEEPGKLMKLEQIPFFASLIVGADTNTRGGRTIDNIMIDRQSTVEFTGRAGVVSLERAFQITQKEALSVSDHLPVWAEFAIQEQPVRAASAVGQPNSGNSFSR